MSKNCKLCNRESTISIHNGLISCANPDCYMDEVEMPQEYWDSLMTPAQSLSDIKAEAVRDIEERQDSKAITMLYAYAGLITSMDTPITFSANHWATPAADIAAAIIESNNLSGYCDFHNYVPPNYEYKEPKANQLKEGEA